MFKRSLAIICCLVLVLALGGCKKNTTDNSSSDSLPAVVEKDDSIPNPLTGLKMEPELENNKPVAVMINNIRTAQPVQTGLNSFDIIYETEVEGGITRMMGVTKDIANMPQIGTVRSARYVYLDLALGHDAQYVHAGLDVVYFAPYRESLGFKSFDINTGATSAYGFRVKNGLASEHTMYTTGQKIDEGLDKLGYSRTTTKNEWIKFNEEDKPATLSSSCVKATIPFSNSYTTGFIFDEESGKYIKNCNGTERTDYLTGEKLAVTNIFVLYTPMNHYPDGYHMKVSLNGGTGYYISNGSYEEIKWQKGDAHEPLTFLKADGSEFTANAGNSYICIVRNDMRSSLALTPAATTATTSSEQ